MLCIRVLNFSPLEIYSFQFTSSIYILMYKRLLVAAACIFLAFTACDINYSVPDIEVGTANFQVQSTSTALSAQNFEYTFSQTFSATPRVALALASFSLRSANFTSWDITPSQIFKTSARIQFQQEPQYWISATVRIFASARADITVGNQMATFNAVKNNMITFPVSFSPQTSNIQQMSKIFLTGYRRLSGNSMDLRAKSVSMTTNSLTVLLETKSDLEINSARVNFIMFDPRNVGFLAYGDQINKIQFSGSAVQSLQRNIHQSNYIFYGIISLKFTQQGAFNLNSDIMQPYYMRYEASRPLEQFTFYYIVIGAANSQGCANCPGKMMYRTQCVNTCPGDSFLATYDNGVQGCRTCPAELHMTINSARNDCVCGAGYINQNGDCKANGQGFTTSATAQAQNIIPTQNQNIIPTQTQNILPATATTQSYNPYVGINTPTPQSQPAPVQQTTLAAQTATPTPVKNVDCTSLPNSILIGGICVCKVGFKQVNGVCIRSTLKEDPYIFKPAQFISKVSYIYTNQKPTFCVKTNEYYDGESCKCVAGFKRTSDGNCILENIPDLTCPPNSTPQNGACICNQGYVKSGEVCILKSSCPANSFNNGVQCVCEAGYYKENNVCVKGQPCPAYSERKNGQCTCITGYSMVNGNCARCPEGQAYVPAENKCVVTCGINEVINAQTKKCECREGYGKYEGICNICPKQFFVVNGFCVACPIGSTYDAKSLKCICGPGLLMHSSGYCQKTCTKPNQAYSATYNACRCANGLARVNGNCEICPSGNIDPATQACSQSCGTNQVLQGGVCRCQNGYGYNSKGACIDCSTLSGSFLIDGFCATCPFGQVALNGKCSCPSGQKLVDNKCQDSCGAGQAEDNQGNCYFCPLNQILVNGACECRDGFTMNGNLCENSCKDGQFLYNGRCAVCALNTVYDSALRACVCPKGFYMDNKGICAQSVLPPIDCPAGKFYDAANGCINCPAGCSACKDALTCTKCSSVGFVPQGNKCVAQCGDGNILPGEECDDKNSVSGDGCSNICKIEANYKCGGIPSVCTRGPVCGDGVISGVEKCDDKNTVSGDGCSRTCEVEAGYTCTDTPSKCTKGSGNVNYGMQLNQKILINYSNIFAMIKTDKTFIFNSDTQMRAFMKYSFPSAGTEPNSVFCLQESYDAKLFRCMVVYSSGVPNYPFKINFSYNYQGSSGFLAVDVNPMANSFQTRSLS